MMAAKIPDVSVVMSVYNGAAALPTTLDSVLAQDDCDFEFVVVNDGSTDDSGSILDAYAARDSRLRVIHQANTGLTRALIRGCAEASGELIARQDCGDVSLPVRLSTQVGALRANPDAVMVACATQFVGPAGELLYQIRRTESELTDGLSATDVAEVSGPPHHGSTMFRRIDYVAVGGYRAQFVVAQDLDLWLRLVERGRCIGLPTLGYQAIIEMGSISMRRRDEQLRLAELAVACKNLRRSGQSDTELVNGCAPARPTGSAKPVTRSERASYYYYLGSCLRKHDPIAARTYFRRALREQPFFVRAMARVVWG